MDLSLDTIKLFGNTIYFYSITFSFSWGSQKSEICSTYLINAGNDVIGFNEKEENKAFALLKIQSCTSLNTFLIKDFFYSSSKIK